MWRSQLAYSEYDLKGRSNGRSGRSSSFRVLVPRPPMSKSRAISRRSSNSDNSLAARDWHYRGHTGSASLTFLESLHLRMFKSPVTLRLSEASGSSLEESSRLTLLRGDSTERPSDTLDTTILATSPRSGYKDSSLVEEKKSSMFDGSLRRSRSLVFSFLQLFKNQAILLLSDNKGNNSEEKELNSMFAGNCTGDRSFPGSPVNWTLAGLPAGYISVPTGIT